MFFFFFLNFWLLCYAFVRFENKKHLEYFAFVRFESKNNTWDILPLMNFNHKIHSSINVDRRKAQSKLLDQEHIVHFLNLI